MFAGYDLWDGVIISNAFETENRGIYWNWFTESGWFLVPLIYDVFYFFIDKDDALRWMIFFMLVCHLSSAEQLRRIGKRHFDLNESAVLTVVAFFLFSPVWAIFTSSVFVMHALTLFIALYCACKILDKGYNKSFLYQLFSLLCFQQASCAVLILSLLFAEYVYNYKKRKSELYFYVFYVFCSVSYFFAARYVFPAHGLYDGYNEIKVSNIFQVDGFFIFYQFINALYPLFIFVILWGVAVFPRKGRLLLSLLIFLLVVNIIPFVSVSKLPYASNIFSYHGWSQRQGITLIPLMALCFGTVIMYAGNKGRVNKILLYSIVFISLALSVTSGFKALNYKAKSVYLFKGLEYALSSKVKDFSVCDIVIKHDESPIFNNISNYQLAYVARRVFGSERRIYTRKYDWENRLMGNSDYRRKYMLPDRPSNCTQYLSVYTALPSMGLIDAALSAPDYSVKVVFSD